MLAAVEGITDAARLQMGRELVLRVEAVDLSALVHTVVRTFNEASAWSGRQAWQQWADIRGGHDQAGGCRLAR
jgi:hypothetical protein